jgi:hypothetical protein
MMAARGGTGEACMMDIKEGAMRCLCGVIRWRERKKERKERGNMWCSVRTWPVLPSPLFFLLIFS